MLENMAQVKGIFDKFDRQAKERKAIFDRLVASRASVKQIEVLKKAIRFGFKSEKIFFSPDGRRIAIRLEAQDTNFLFIYPNGEYGRYATAADIKPF